MIYGIGTDIVQVERIARLHGKYGERLVQRLLMPQEIQALQGQSRDTRFLAMRFAAKEAIVKALGTGFAQGIGMRDVGIASDTLGRPHIIWSPRGEIRRRELGIGEGHITLSDEAGLVVAMAVLLRAA